MLPWEVGMETMVVVVLRGVGVEETIWEAQGALGEVEEEILVEAWAMTRGLPMVVTEVEAEVEQLSWSTAWSQTSSIVLGCSTYSASMATSTGSCS